MDDKLRCRKETTTGFACDDRFLDHKPLPMDDIESEFRIKSVKRLFENPSFSEKFKKIEIGSADPSEYIMAFHPEGHIRLVEEIAHSEKICRLAVSACLSAVDSVCSGSCTNAFCAVRPPGHHAFDKGPFGFCYYNNAAISAKYAQRKYELSKILIVDWDYHHGNGTQDGFYYDPSVLYFSTHNLDAFPGTGFEQSTGLGAGLGFNINVPMPAGSGDDDFIEVFRDRLVPAAESFMPDLIIISAGFDSGVDDFIGDFDISERGYYDLTRIVMDISDRFCSSKIVSILEGGYNPRKLGKPVAAHLKALCGMDFED